MTTPNYEHNYETGETTVVLFYDNNISFTGRAKLHPDDKDNPVLGARIATARACIKYLKFIKNTIYKTELDAYKHLYKDMATSKKFNPKSYEAISLYKRINHINKDIAAMDEIIAEEAQLIKILSE